jgi:predicted RNA-binding protein with PIN domain
MTEMSITLLLVVLFLLYLSQTQLHFAQDALIIKVYQEVMGAQCQSIFDSHHSERLRELFINVTNLKLVADTFAPQKIGHIKCNQLESIISATHVIDKLF